MGRIIRIDRHRKETKGVTRGDADGMEIKRINLSVDGRKTCEVDGTAVGLINRDYSPGFTISETELNRTEREGDVNIYIYLFIRDIRYYFHVNETLIHPLPILCFIIIRNSTRNEFLYIIELLKSGGNFDDTSSSRTINNSGRYIE